MRRKNRQRGSAMVEFALAGIASTTILISTFQIAMIMWNYHTMAFVVHEATRYAAVHGIGCTKPGNSCRINVGNIAHRIDQLGIGIPSAKVNVTLTTDSGAQTLCAPLKSCFANATVWPPASNEDNKTGKLITISARYNFKSALLFFWPGVGTQKFGAISLPATSTQSVVF